MSSDISFKKGASFVSSMAFLLASTNLVIVLGIVISMFLGWQFVLGDYGGGILLLEKALKYLAFISFILLLGGFLVKYIFNY